MVNCHDKVETPYRTAGIGTRPVAATGYFGPDRRRSRAAAPPDLLGAVLDELDYGVVLLSSDDEVVHINHAAVVELDAGHPLRRVGRRLQARDEGDTAQLRTALRNASQRGLRKLLSLGEGSDASCVSVVPLPTRSADPIGHEAASTLVVLGKRQVCESLSVEGFAQSHGLTRAETRVLAALCRGLPPTRIAAEIGVAISTVRTHIGTVRVKTGSDSIRALVEKVAQLPPLRGVLREASSGGAAHVGGHRATGTVGAGAERCEPRNL